jgi:hypothetical protein
MANTIQIGADTSGFVSGINRAQSAMAGLGSMIQNVVGGAAVFSALAAAARGFYGAIQAGDDLVDLNAQTGVAIDKLMELQLAFDLNGMKAEQVQPVLAKLQKSISEAASGSVDAAAKFAQMGLDISELQGLTADEQLAKVGQAISKIENPAQRSAMAMEIFGKQGAKLLAVFAAGGMDEVRELLGNQAALMLENAGIFGKASDLLSVVGDKLKGFFVGVASEVVPQLMGVIEAAAKIDLSKIGQAFGDAISFWINYFNNFGSTGELIYNTMKLAFQGAVNFLAEEIKVLMAQTAASVKNVFKGEAAQKAAIQEAEIQARAGGPVFDTTETEAKIQGAMDAINASKEATADAARAANPTPGAAPTGMDFLKKATAGSTGPIGIPDISSLQKVGGGSRLLSGGQDNSPAYQSVRIQEDIRDYMKDLIDAVKAGGQSYQISPSQSGGMVLTA